MKDLIKLVDKDGSGKIEFDEFLDIIKSSEGGDKSAKMFNFFKGKRGEGERARRHCLGEDEG